MQSFTLDSISGRSLRKTNSDLFLPLPRVGKRCTNPDSGDSSPFLFECSTFSLAN